MERGPDPERLGYTYACVYSLPGAKNDFYILGLRFG